MRVAFTSTTGAEVDEHFGTASRFFIWDIGPEAAAPVDELPAPPPTDDEEDRITARAAVLAGCAIVYTVAIGGPAAAKLVARRIHPMKTQEPKPIAELVAQLQQVLRGNPPPWLRKLLATAPAPAAGAL
jgi:nitrogen fixation protein NifX